MTIRAELRTKENASATDQRFVRIFNYHKFLPWLTGEINFEGNQTNLGGGQWRNAFRIHLGLTAGADIRLCPSSSLNIYYMFKTAYPSNADINVLGLGLTVSL